MKKIIMFLMMLAVVLPTSARKYSKQLKTTPESTIVILKDTKMRKESKISAAVLRNDGNEVPASSVLCQYENCVNTYTLTFPRQDVLSKTVLCIVIEGKKQTVNLWKQVEKFVAGYYSTFIPDDLMIVLTDYV